MAQTPVDFDAVRAANACFKPSPQATLIKGEAVPDSLFSSASGITMISGAASGWPLCCLEGYRVVQLNAPNFTSTNVDNLTFGNHGGPVAGWSIPTHPRWFPLAVNFTVGVGVSILLSHLVQARRRRRRSRHGLCPNCAYNRAALAPGAPCPECGALAPV